MPLSKFIVDILESKQEASIVFHNKEFTRDHQKELIQEAKKGNEWAQYYAGM